MAAELGQFYTTNFSKILKNLGGFPRGAKVIEPFCGTGELLKWPGADAAEKYDIDPKCPGVVVRDTLMNPPTYNGKWVITNPPYLARNKAQDKTIFDKYTSDDLYKCFIRTLIRDPPEGGILIVPLNFWCSTTTTQLSDIFVKLFWVETMNVFEEQVFDDTTYTVCSFKFHRGDTGGRPTGVHLYPSGKFMTQHLDALPFGRDIYHLETPRDLVITRATRDNPRNTNIHVKLFDDIHAWCDAGEDHTDRTPRLTQRMYCTLRIEPPVGDEEELCRRFNTLLGEYREKHHSLFLTNYREGNRKRISFALVYLIFKHVFW